MCGIFGFIGNKQTNITPHTIKKIVKKLFVLSESRGKEAAGIALRTSEKMMVAKQPVRAKEFIENKDCLSVFDQFSLPMSIIGHSRLATDGGRFHGDNNQPVIHENLVAVHNGIVTNVDTLWRTHPDLKRTRELDTEIILALLTKSFKNNLSLPAATFDVFQQIEGSANIAVLSATSTELLLATNSGSLYVIPGHDQNCYFFASERFILEKMVSDLGMAKTLNVDAIWQLKHRTAALICQTGEISNFSLTSREDFPVQCPKSTVTFSNISDSKEAVQPISHSQHTFTTASRDAMLKRWDTIYNTSTIKRCTRCVLPETMPFIKFDTHGVCNYCHAYTPIQTQGEQVLKKELSHLNKNKDGQDSLFCLSGGRDSCYGLHYVKTQLGLNPIAYSYDWGLITDLARRNSARMCGKLGVDHIIISADIPKKRAAVRKNINAWLKRPSLGMIPLLMAGDKQMMHYSALLMRRTEVDTILWSAGNGLELSPFKLGFAGVLQQNYKPHMQMQLSEKLQLAKFYFKEVAKNPLYLNSSLFDSVWAFWCNFIHSIETNNILLYKYIPWDEKTINDVLTKEYNWEISSDTTTTWRIGDGTASFYNYAYMAMTGFSEHETMRSNLVREGRISREEAVTLIREDNRPRFESFEWYSQVINFDCNEAVKKINEQKTLFSD